MASTLRGSLAGVTAPSEWRDGIEYPVQEDLDFWWACWRKIGYPTAAEAQAVTDEFDGPAKSDLEPYVCEWCDRWHNGKARDPEARNSPRKSHGPSQLRKQWRRWAVKPSIPELHEARVSRRGRGVTPNID